MSTFCPPSIDIKIKKKTNLYRYKMIMCKNTKTITLEKLN